MMNGNIWLPFLIFLYGKKTYIKYYQVNYPELYFLNVIETGDEDIFIDKYDVNEGL